MTTTTTTTTKSTITAMARNKRRRNSLEWDSIDEGHVQLAYKHNIVVKCYWTLTNLQIA